MRRALVILLLLAAGVAVVVVTLTTLRDGPSIRAGAGAASGETAPREPLDAQPLPPPPARRTDPGAPLSGAVLSAGGVPAAGAEVRVSLLPAFGALGETPPPPFLRAVTDEEGLFGVPDAPPGHLAFAARADGHGPAFLVLRDYEAGARVRVVLRLAPLVAIEGTVRDERGDAIPEAYVRCAPAAVLRAFVAQAPGLARLDTAEGADTEADEAGRYRLEGLQPGLYDVTLKAEGMIPATLFAVHAPAEEVDVFLREGLSLSGTISWPPGGEPGAFSVRTDPLDRAAAIETGEGQATFRIDGLPAGAYDLHLRAGGYADEVRRVVLERGADPPVVDFVLRPGTRVTGRVLDVDEGTPLAGATVVFLRVVPGPDGERLEERARVAADAEGGYEVDLGPGRWVGRAEMDGYVDPLPPWPSHAGRVDSRKVFTVGAGAVERSYELRRRATIRGRVVYGDGSPARARVSIGHVETRIAGRVPPWGRPTTTDEDGRYVIEGVVPWAVYTVRATAGRDTDDEVEDVAIPEGRTEVVLQDLVVYRPGGGGGPGADPTLATVRARVVDERGDAIAGAVVSIGGRAASSGPDGRFEVVDIPPGEKRVMAVAAGFPPTVFETVTLRPGENAVLPDFVLPDEGAMLMGRVLDTANRPIDGAVVRVRFAGLDHVFETVTGHDGVYELEGPSAPLVGVSVEARAKGYAPGVVQDAIADTRVVDVVIEEYAAVEGTLTFKGDPPGALTVTCRPDGRGEPITREATLGKGGRSFRCDDLPPGTYGLLLSAPGFASRTVTVRLEEGRTHRLASIELTRGGTILGRIEPKDGEGVPVCSVWIHGTEFRTVSDAKGRFRFDLVPAGNVTILARPRGGEKFSIAHVHVVAGKSVPVTIRLR